MTQAVAVKKEAAAPARAVSPVDSVRAALEKMKPQMEMALPKHLTADRLLRVAMTAIQNNPKLLECSRTSLFAAIMSCAQLGLEPDGVLGQAYLIPYGSTAQFIPGYKGLISLARNSGDVESIQAHEVCEKDEFDYELGLNERLRHKPATGDRGPIVYFWALARFKNGGHHWEVMTKADVDLIRSRSPGKNSTPWKEHYTEMGKKTVIRRLAKYLPLSVQKLQAASALEDAAERGHYASVGAHGEVTIDNEAPSTAPDADDMITDDVVAADKKADTQLDAFEAA